MKAFCLATMLVCLSLIGCARAYVVSGDRKALWQAGVAAVEESNFQKMAADEAGGIIRATMTRTTDAAVTERLNLTMTFEQVGSEYRAKVIVRRSGEPLDLPTVDFALSYQRGHEGGTGRTSDQYGTVSRRDTTLERDILQRMREWLAPRAIERAGGGA